MAKPRTTFFFSSFSKIRSVWQSNSSHTVATRPSGNSLGFNSWSWGIYLFLRTIRYRRLFEPVNKVWETENKPTPRFLAAFSTSTVLIFSIFKSISKRCGFPWSFKPQIKLISTIERGRAVLSICFFGKRVKIWPFFYLKHMFLGSKMKMAV